MNSPVKTSDRNFMVEQLHALYVPQADATIETLRQTSWARFAQSGLPSRHNEAWHYSDLSHILSHLAPAHSPTQLASDKNTFGFVNGHLVAQGALPAGITCRRLSDVSMTKSCCRLFMKNRALMMPLPLSPLH
jgi:hypothetical protein